MDNENLGLVKSDKQVKAEKKAKVKNEKKAKAKTSQTKGIADFATEFIKAKGTGLTVQGKASRKLKGLTGALITRKWSQDPKDPLKFTITKKDRKFEVSMQGDGTQATLVTKGQAVSFPLGKGAFKSVDYILSAYGFRYLSATQKYEEGQSVV